MQQAIKDQVIQHIHKNYRPERASRLLEVLEIYGDEFNGEDHDS